jgi:hypothetical protein
MLKEWRESGIVNWIYHDSRRSQTCVFIANFIKDKRKWQDLLKNRPYRIKFANPPKEIVKISFRGLRKYSSLVLNTLGSKLEDSFLYFSKRSGFVDMYFTKFPIAIYFCENKKMKIKETYGAPIYIEREKRCTNCNFVGHEKESCNMSNWKTHWMKLKEKIGNWVFEQHDIRKEETKELIEIHDKKEVKTKQEDLSKEINKNTTQEEKSDSKEETCSHKWKKNSKKRTFKCEVCKEKVVSDTSYFCDFCKIGMCNACQDKGS